VFVDDATSQITALRFVHSESTFAYFGTLRDHLVAHGKPLALYSDKASVFRVNHKSSRGEGQTQFARTLDELNIEGFCAHSSAAKGRVERAHLTLQDRLVKELRLAGISSIDDANAWLPGCLASSPITTGASVKPPCMRWTYTAPWALMMTWSVP
jgi:hypothetical protein